MAHREDTRAVNQQEHEEIAELLLEVYASGEPVEPLTAKFPGLTVGDAYEIQLLQQPADVVPGAGVDVCLAGAGHRSGQDQPVVPTEQPGRPGRPGRRRPVLAAHA